MLGITSIQPARQDKATGYNPSRKFGALLSVCLALWNMLFEGVISAIYSFLGQWLICQVSYILVRQAGRQTDRETDTDGWMDGWMSGWVGGWMDGWMDGLDRSRVDRQAGRLD